MGICVLASFFRVSSSDSTSMIFVIDLDPARQEIDRQLGYLFMFERIQARPARAGNGNYLSFCISLGLYLFIHLSIVTVRFIRVRSCSVTVNNKRYKQSSQSPN